MFARRVRIMADDSSYIDLVSYFDEYMADNT